MFSHYNTSSLHQLKPTDVIATEDEREEGFGARVGRFYIQVNPEKYKLSSLEKLQIENAFHSFVRRKIPKICIEKAEVDVDNTGKYYIIFLIGGTESELESFIKRMEDIILQKPSSRLLYHSDLVEISLLSYPNNEYHDIKEDKQTITLTKKNTKREITWTRSSYKCTYTLAEKFSDLTEKDLEGIKNVLEWHTHTRFDIKDGYIEYTLDEISWTKRAALDRILWSIGTIFNDNKYLTLDSCIKHVIRTQGITLVKYNEDKVKQYLEKLLNAKPEEDHYICSVFLDISVDIVLIQSIGPEDHHIDLDSIEIELLKCV